MKTVYRFVLKAYVGPMVLTFFIVMFILLMHYLWMHIDELVGKGLGPGVIIELVFYASATLVPMGLPLATLLASIMTMGNLGENNELLALKAAGISLPRIMKPLIILMTVVCIGSFFIINNFTPYSYQKMFSLL
ncbi:MAG: LptF/LptG family permease, partial [Rikenella sp.]|nr:LptF/LptG family permease [Rikenella sp.]